jgi:hypothetical protein
MGPIAGRNNENLVSSDNDIVLARLMRAARQLSENDTTPPGVDVAHLRARSATLVPPDQAPSSVSAAVSRFHRSNEARRHNPFDRRVYVNELISLIQISLSSSCLRRSLIILVKRRLGGVEASRCYT